MADIEGVLTTNAREDVSWLCSLSESELDFLISIKQLVIRRANMIRHDELAQKFDLKMLRSLARILMEHLKGKLEDVSVYPGLPNTTVSMDICNLLKSNLGNSLTIEELTTRLVYNPRQRCIKRPREE